MWHMWGGGWGMWLVGGLVMLLFWGAVLALAFFAFRALSRGGGSEERHYSSGSSERPLQILKERYARGELTREEYLEMRRELET